VGRGNVWNLGGFGTSKFLVSFSLMKKGVLCTLIRKNILAYILSKSAINI
jgi:hypothetical protein